MENLNYSKIISDATFHDEFETKTLMYRVNGFFEALNISSKYNSYEKTYDLIDAKYHRGVKFSSSDDNLFIFAIKKYDLKYGDYYHLTGESDEFGFTFDNYYGKKKLDRKIIDIPFSIEINSGDYIFKAKTIENERVEFYLEDSSISRSFHFYANVLDFSKVLKLIKNFVNNPELVYKTYEEIMESKKVVFTNTDLKKGIANDEKLEKPMSKLGKKIKILVNND